VDQGARVSTYTVAREMGHGGEAMVRKVYGQLGQVRHRAEAVEYRRAHRATRLVFPGATTTPGIPRRSPSGRPGRIAPASEPRPWQVMQAHAE